MARPSVKRTEQVFHFSKSAASMRGSGRALVQLRDEAFAVFSLGFELSRGLFELFGHHEKDILEGGIHCSGGLLAAVLRMGSQLISLLNHPEHNAEQINSLLRLFRRTKAFDSVMDTQERKPRRVETSEERKARLDKEHRKSRDRALAEQDELDAMVRRSIAMHGA